MAYIENCVWTNNTTSFTTADEAISDMRSYFDSSYDSQDKPVAENITFDSETQTLSFTRDWDTEQQRNNFQSWLETNQVIMGGWIRTE
tara:strand:+ start:558 stop:821 length:264 start_codon:yes stop_codon:yes gene_type:complete